VLLIELFENRERLDQPCFGLSGVGYCANFIEANDEIDLCLHIILVLSREPVADIEALLIGGKCARPIALPELHFADPIEAHRYVAPCFSVARIVSREPAANI